MIKSKFILDILLLLIDEDINEIELRQQVDYLNISEYNYTGAGLIIEFKNDININEFRIKNEKILNGVLIESSELEISAEANLFFQEGIIKSLEIFSHSGVYPKKELNDYKLSQSWKPNGGKQIKFP